MEKDEGKKCLKRSLGGSYGDADTSDQLFRVRRRACRHARELHEASSIGS
mgnify:CR=1 FL=1